MKKILIPCEITHTRFNVISFAAKISKEKSVPVYGFFLKESEEGTGFKYAFPNDLSLTQEKMSREYIAAENARDLEDDIKLFKDECESEGVAYQIEQDISLKQFIDAASDEDLVITDTRADFLETLLTNSPCPAYLVSESEKPGKVVLLYDGSNLSKHAINKYMSFFPEWLTLPTALVSINENEKKQQEIELYAKSLQTSFINLAIEFLDGDKEKVLVAFIDQYDYNALMVMGAFGRSALSRFFHESLANTVIDNSRCSLFIAHAKA